MMRTLEYSAKMALTPCTASAKRIECFHLFMLPLGNVTREVELWQNRRIDGTFRKHSILTKEIHRIEIKQWVGEGPVTADPDSWIGSEKLLKFKN